MTTDTIQSIALADLRESPFNPRRTFVEDRLQELAEDVKSHGILSPLLVRPFMPNVLRTVHDPADGYELVFGHRRLRAARMAGLEAVPCMVRVMTNDEVRAAQISENLSREDVHPIEEAEGFEALIRGGAETADSLATRFGKSRSYVYGRLKLLQACKPVRDACLKGKIGSEVALLLARLRTDKLQQKALARIEGKFLNLEDGGAKSFRAIRDLLAEHFTLDLKSPLFDPADALLVPEAGTCAACPKRVGNAPEYADLLTKADHSYGRKFNGNADVCTDPDCYEAKKVAHLRNEAAALANSGKVVVDGAKARQAIGADGQVKGAYVALKDVKKELAVARAKAQKNSALPPPLVVTIQDPRTGKKVEAVKVADLVALGTRKATPKSERQDLKAQRKQREAEHEAHEERKRVEQAARLNVLKAIRTKLPSVERSAFDMTLIARRMFDGVDYWPKKLLAELWEAKDLDSEIDTMTPDELMLLLFDCALIEDCHVEWENAPQDDLLKVAAYYGVDVAVARGEKPAPAEGVSSPSTAARAPKGAKAKAGKSAAPKKPPLSRAVDLVGDALVEGQPVDAGSAGAEVNDEPADAGAAPERDPNTSDMFEEAGQ